MTNPIPALVPRGAGAARLAAQACPELKAAQKAALVAKRERHRARKAGKA